jgi:hypothetical protein
VSRPKFLAPERVPFVEVEVVRVGVDTSGTVRPFVDVELRPKPADQPCTPRCWWDWVRPSVLKCRRCGRLKIAER